MLPLTIMRMRRASPVAALSPAPASETVLTAKASAVNARSTLRTRVRSIRPPSAADRLLMSVAAVLLPVPARGPP